MEENKGSDRLRRIFNWEEVRQRIASGRVAMDGVEEATSELAQKILEQRARRLALAPVEETDRREMVDLVFVRSGRELYGLDVQYITALRPVERITRVPRVPEWVVGVVNLRGHILSVVDLRRFFDLPEGQGQGISPYLITVETPEMELALLADEVLAVGTVPVGQIQEAGGTVRGIRPEYVRGFVRRESDNGESLVVVLDLKAVLAARHLVIYEEIV